MIATTTPNPTARESAYEDLRNAMVRAGFTETGVCSHYSISSLRLLRLDIDLIENPTAPDDAFRCLARLFIECRYVPEDRLTEHLGAGTVAAMRELGILEGSGEETWSNVMLCPVAGLLMATDRWTDPAGHREQAPDDILYPAHAPNTLILLGSALFGRCERVLDLCSGTGIAGLYASRLAGRVVAADINPRATEYARFNARLNAIGNLEARTGDLWDAAAGETFDLVVGHPPYVPIFRQKWIFHSGGVDGEQICQKIISGLPGHLKPGGRYCGLMMSSDRKDGTVESRVRAWLGAAHEEFDVVVVSLRTFELDAFVDSTVLKNSGTLQDVKAWREKLDALGVQRFNFCNLIIERVAGGRPGATARRTDGPASGRAEYEWLLGLEQAAASPGFAERLLDARLFPPVRMAMQISHELEAGTWMANSYTLTVEYPFRVTLAVPGWQAVLVSKCDGTRTGREFYEAYRDGGAIPENVSAYSFGLALQVLVQAGFVEMEGFRTPRAAG